jgi:hypothetical protein|tara:strand:- start:60 stop:515 length:456 start_codon:yes stop_codon:yes gene_type:complete
VLEIQPQVDKVVCEQVLINYIIQVVTAMRSSSHLALGVSPRGGVTLQQAERARAFLSGGFIFMIFGFGLGTINTGNNLLYLVLAMCRSLVAVSGMLSELSLKKLSVTAQLKNAIYSQDPSPITFSLKNYKKKSRHILCPSISPQLIFPKPV